MKNFSLILVLCLISAISLFAQSPAGFKEIELPKPPQISQQIKSNHDGWTVLNEQATYDLQGITVYDGHPSEQASLVPDRTIKNKNNLYSIWTFDLSSNRNIWIKCGFSRTTITLSKALPSGIKELRIYYKVNIKIDGYFQIRKVLYR